MMTDKTYFMSILSRAVIDVHNNETTKYKNSESRIYYQEFTDLVKEFMKDRYQEPKPENKTA